MSFRENICFLFRYDTRVCYTTFRYMRCFAERSGAKYGRAKCNEWTAYTVLYAPSGVYGARVQRGATVGSKSIFSLFFLRKRLFLFLSFFKKVWFSVPKNSRGVGGELNFLELLICVSFFVIKTSLLTILLIVSKFLDL